jgi:hypothetical protein
MSIKATGKAISEFAGNCAAGITVAFLADHRTQDLIAHEQDAEFAETLNAPRHQFRPRERAPEEYDHDRRADDREQHRLVEGE